MHNSSQAYQNFVLGHQKEILIALSYKGSKYKLSALETLALEKLPQYVLWSLPLPPQLEELWRQENDFLHFQATCRNNLLVDQIRKKNIIEVCNGKHTTAFTHMQMVDHNIVIDKVVVNDKMVNDLILYPHYSFGIGQITGYASTNGKVCYYPDEVSEEMVVLDTASKQVDAMLGGLPSKDTAWLKPLILQFIL